MLRDLSMNKVGRMVVYPTDRGQAGWTCKVLYAATTESKETVFALEEVDKGTPYTCSRDEYYAACDLYLERVDSASGLGMGRGQRARQQRVRVIVVDIFSLCLWMAYADGGPVLPTLFLTSAGTMRRSFLARATTPM